jgi:hypothetical protein
MTSFKNLKSMKLAYFILSFFILLNCRRIEVKDETFCGVSDPGNDLPWLKEIIDIAETHQNVNYIGAIWAEEYLKNDVVYVEMSLGSGGLLGHWFNCDGTALKITPGNAPSATKKQLIYKSY